MCPVRADWGLPLLTLLMPVLFLVPAAPIAAQGTWAPTDIVGAPSARGGHTAVWTGSKMIIWGGSGVSHQNTGGIYDPATDTWTAMSTTNAPSGRQDHTAVWTGSKMIVWGGSSRTGAGATYYYNTGGIYDPATDRWTATSTVNAPWHRTLHTAVWTGSRMIVWGGYGVSSLNAGGIYDPATDRWTAMSTTGVPRELFYHSAVWTGSKMIVWGGANDSAAPTLNTGHIYDAATDTWTATSATNAPSVRYQHSAVWTGSKMVVWGGYDVSSMLNTGGIYDPATDTWTATSTADAPSARRFHSAVWTGSKMIVWGGLGDPHPVTGGIYDPATDAWTGTSVMNTPLARYGHTTAWTGSRMIVWGGVGTSPISLLNDGGVYSNPAVIPPLPPAADFFTVTPCRLVDTRNAASPTGGPALSPGATRNFPVTGGVCGIPSTAIAISANLTVTQPAAQGYLVLYPGDAAGPPLMSSINFQPGVTRANNAIVLLATNGGTINVNNGSAGAVHFVLDVNAYFQ